jgi:hypothetical protein
MPREKMAFIEEHRDWINEAKRMALNIDIFDFSLSDDDMAQIARMNQHDAGTRDFGDPQFVKYLIETYG